MTYTEEDLETAQILYSDDFRVRDLARFVRDRRILAAALENLLNWGRDNTSPVEANSPHELLVAAAEALHTTHGE